MEKGAYIGVNGAARKVKAEYIGVAGVARKVKKGYVGVNGAARESFGVELPYQFSCMGGISGSDRFGQSTGASFSVTFYMTGSRHYEAEVTFSAPYMNAASLGLRDHAVLNEVTSATAYWQGFTIGMTEKTGQVITFSLGSNYMVNGSSTAKFELYC